MFISYTSGKQLLSKNYPIYKLVYLKIEIV